MYKLDNNVEWTEELKNAFKTGTTRAKIIYDGDKEINETNALKNLTIKDTQYIPNLGFIGQACSKELSFSFVNTEGINLENKEVIVKIGAEYNGDVYYITYGNFIVSEAPQNDKTNNVTNVVANDYMIKFDVPYEDTITYPCTLKELVENICEKVGVELGSESFSNQDFIVVDNQFENNVAREVIKNAAKCAFSWARIGQDNKLYFDFEPSEEIEIAGSNFTITNANPLQGGSVTEIKAPDNSTTVEGTSLTITDADETKKARVTEIKGSGQRPILPEEYQEVEYIESNGTQYIDTGIIGNITDNLKIRTKFVLTQLSTGREQAIMGNKNASNTGCTIFFSPNSRLIKNWSGSGTAWNIANIDLNEITELEMTWKVPRGRNTNINGTNYENTTVANNSTSNNTSFAIFNDKPSTSLDSAYLKMYYYEIYIDDELKIQLIPCYNIFSGKIGMYDLVQGKFFTSIGTDEFLKGADIVYDNVTGDNNIVVSNKNLYNVEDTLEGKYYSSNGTITTNANSFGIMIPLNASVISYSIKNNSTSNVNDYVFFFDRNMNRVSAPRWGTTVASGGNYTLNNFSTTNAVYVAISIIGISPSQKNEIQIQLEKGNQATEYTEHKGSSYRVDLGGKNKFNYQYSQLRNINRATISEETNGFKLTSTGVAGYGFASLPIDNNLLGKQVTISCNSSGNKTPSARLFYHNASGSLTSNIGAFWTTNNAHTVTLPSTLPSGSTGIDIVFYISQGNNAEGDYVTFTNIQIEERKCSN